MIGLPVITDTRPGQHPTLTAARAAARRESRSTGRPHRVVEAVAWRDLTPFRCWTIQLSTHRNGR